MGHSMGCSFGGTSWPLHCPVSAQATSSAQALALHCPDSAAQAGGLKRVAAMIVRDHGPHRIWQPTGPQGPLSAKKGVLHSTSNGRWLARILVVVRWTTMHKTKCHLRSDAYISLYPRRHRDDSPLPGTSRNGHQNSTRPPDGAAVDTAKGPVHHSKSSLLRCPPKPAKVPSCHFFAVRFGFGFLFVFCATEARGFCAPPFTACSPMGCRGP